MESSNLAETCDKPPSDLRSSESRPQISDGKRLRDVWVQGDGNGDADPTVYERFRYAREGHPTWKIYCGKSPQKISGILVEPPRFCYLDDLACDKILHSPRYTIGERGRYWKFDFNSKGAVRIGRLNRGRPAFQSDGQTYACADNERPGTKRSVYQFTGGSAEDLAVIIDATRAGILHEGLQMTFQNETESASTPLSRKRKPDLLDKNEHQEELFVAAQSNPTVEQYLGLGNSILRHKRTANNAEAGARREVNRVPRNLVANLLGGSPDHAASRAVEAIPNTTDSVTLRHHLDVYREGAKALYALQSRWQSVMGTVDSLEQNVRDAYTALYKVRSDGRQLVRDVENIKQAMRVEIGGERMELFLGEIDAEYEAGVQREGSGAVQPSKRDDDDECARLYLGINGTLEGLDEDLDQSRRQ